MIRSEGSARDTARGARGWAGAVAALLLAVVAVAYVRALVIFLRGPRATEFDDAYMFARYARNVLDGYGFAWNPGEPPVHGPTSVLYVFVIAAATASTHGPPELVLPITSWILGAAALVVMAAIGWSLVREARHVAVLFAAGALAWALVDPGLRYHAVSGMDTTLALLTNALLVLVTLKLQRAFRARWLLVAALAGYATTCARPDDALYALLAPALAIAFRPSPSPIDWRHALAYAALFGALVLGDLALEAHVLGDALPLSYYVKQSGFYAGYAGTALWNPVTFLRQFARGTLPCWLVLVLGARRRHLRLIAPFLVPVALTLGHAFTVVQIMGYEARFYFPALPFIYTAAVVVMADLASRDRRAWRLRHPGTVAAAVLLLAGVSPLGRRIDDVYARTLAARAAAPPHKDPDRSSPLWIGWWGSIQAMSALMKELPRGTIVAATEVGHIGSSAEGVTLVDMTGLNDPYFAHHGFSVAALLARQPDLVWLPHADYTRMVHDLLCSDDFYAHYDVYPNAYGFGIAVATGPPARSGRQGAVARSWASTYPGAAMSAHVVHAGRSTSGLPFKESVDCR